MADTPLEAAMRRRVRRVLIHMPTWVLRMLAPLRHLPRPEPFADIDAKNKKREWCRREDENGNRCGAPAEFIVWGKLYPPEALGPRCYDCAAGQVGHYGLSPGNPQHHAIHHLPTDPNDPSPRDTPKRGTGHANEESKSVSGGTKEKR